MIVQEPVQVRVNNNNLEISQGWFLLGSNNESRRHINYLISGPPSSLQIVVKCTCLYVVSGSDMALLEPLCLYRRSFSIREVVCRRYAAQIERVDFGCELPKLDCS